MMSETGVGGGAAAPSGASTDEHELKIAKKARGNPANAKELRFM